jgi:hypothetical protein
MKMASILINLEGSNRACATGIASSRTMAIEIFTNN